MTSTPLIFSTPLPDYEVTCLPKPLDLNSDTLYEDFQQWKTSLQLNLITSGYDRKPKRQQTNFIKSIAGQQVAKASTQFNYKTGENKDDPAVFLSKLEDFCRPVCQSMMERCTFDNIKYVDNFERFLMQVLKQAELCDFDNHEDRVKYKIISSVPKYLMNTLMRIGDQSLATIVKLCRESLNPEGTTDYVTDQVGELVFGEVSLQNEDPESSEQSEKVENSFHEPLTGTRRLYRQHVNAYERSMNTPTPAPDKKAADAVNFKRVASRFWGSRHPLGYLSSYCSGTSPLWYSPQYKDRLAGRKTVPASSQTPDKSNYWSPDEVAQFRPRFIGAAELLP